MTGARMRSCWVVFGLALLPPGRANTQAAPAPAPERWVARLSGGIAVQSRELQYASVGLNVGAMVGFRLGRHTALRLDVLRTRFVPRCLDVVAGGFFSGCSQRTAGDTQVDLFLGPGAEFAPEPRGVFVRLSLGGLYHSGVVLGDAGWHPAAVLAVGLRFSDLVALEASAIPVTGTSGTERWRFPISLAIGPGL